MKMKFLVILTFLLTGVADASIWTIGKIGTEDICLMIDETDLTLHMGNESYKPVGLVRPSGSCQTGTKQSGMFNFGTTGIQSVTVKCSESKNVKCQFIIGVEGQRDYSSQMINMGNSGNSYKCSDVSIPMSPNKTILHFDKLQLQAFGIEGGKFSAGKCVNPPTTIPPNTTTHMTTTTTHMTTTTTRMTKTTTRMTKTTTANPANTTSHNMTTTTSASPSNTTTHMTTTTTRMTTSTTANPANTTSHNMTTTTAIPANTTSHMTKTTTANPANTTSHNMTTTTTHMTTTTTANPANTTSHNMTTTTTANPANTTSHNMTTTTTANPANTTSHNMTTTANPANTTSHNMTTTANPANTTSHNMTTTSHMSTKTHMPTTSATPNDRYVVRNGNKTCLVLEADISLAIKWENGTVLNVAVPMRENVTVTGGCANKSDSMKIMFTNATDAVTIEMDFIMENQNYTLSTINIEYNLTVGKHKVEGSSPNANLTLFSTQTGYYYKCDNDTRITLKNGTTMTFQKMRFQSFISDGSTEFSGTVNDCYHPKSKTSVLVPIIVGAVLAGMVVVVLVGYCIGRRRAARNSYEPMS